MKRFLTVLTMLSYLAACTSWQVRPTAPQEAANLRITLADGTRMLLHDSQPIGDSIVGYTTEGSDGPGLHRVAVPMAELQQIEQKRSDTGKTLLVVGLAAIVGLIVAAGSLQTTDPNH